MAANNSAGVLHPGGVEIDVTDWTIVVPFRKSRHSNIDEDGDCVMVADTAAGHRLIRDSKLGAVSPALPVCRGAFDGLLASIRAGDLS